MKYAVIGKKCFDGFKIREDFYFIVEEDKIIEIGDYSLDKVKGLEIIDVKDRVVTPGLIDSHIHICSDPYKFGFQLESFHLAYVVERNLKTLLQEGIVYIRDVGAPANTTNIIKKLVADGELQGPDLKIAGEAICVTGGHGWQMSLECDSSDAIRHAVRDNIKKNVDLIKLMVTGGINTKGNELAPLEMSENEIRTAVEEAHKKGRKVAVHTHGRTGIELSLKSGVDSIEHGLLLDDELAQLALDQNTVVVPTLSAPYFATVQGLKKDPNSKSFKKSQEVMNVHNENIYNAYKKGVTLAMGTDSGTPFNGFDTVLEELILLNNIGIDALDVFKMATVNAAELLEVSDTHGSLEKGKQATFIVFEKDPFINMKNISSNKIVYKNGISQNF